MDETKHANSLSRALSLSLSLSSLFSLLFLSLYLSLTHRSLRLARSKKVPLAIEVISLSKRNLQRWASMRRVLELLSHTHTHTHTHRLSRLERPEKAPLAIDVIWLRSRLLWARGSTHTQHYRAAGCFRV
jgi:hypothetical protein